MKHWFYLLVVALVFVSCDAGTSGGFWVSEGDMRAHFEGAKTPETELEAAKVLNKRFSGYSVTAFDIAGDEIFPPRDGNYDAIHRVTIRFADSGVVASRVILNRDSLIYIYGE